MRECPPTIPIVIAKNTTNPPTPNYLHFVVLRDGALELKVNGKLTRVEEGDVFASQFQIHIDHAKPTADWLSLSFSPTLLHDDLGTNPINQELRPAADMDYWLIEPYLEADFVVVRPQGFHFESLVHDIIDCQESIEKQESPFWRCFARSSVFDFLQTMRRSKETGFNEDAKLLAEVQLYLHNQLSNRPTLESTALSIGLNRTLFARKLRALSGKTFHEILSDLRLQKAEWLVKHTNLPLGQVVEKIGLNDQTHFTRLFKANFSATPSEYRQVHKNKKAENS